jgi:HlyD family secretion protein
MKMKWLWIGIGVAVVAALVVVSAMQSGKSGITAVQFARVRTEDISSRVRAPGKIEAQTQVKISADVPGKIVRLLVKEGDRVRKGQLMLQLDDAQYRADSDQQKAALSAARAHDRDNEGALKVIEANYTRQKALWEQKLLSQAEWDQATRAVDAARVANQAGREDVSRCQAALEASNNRLSKTRFEAPFNGVVSALNVEAGEMVITGTMNNPGTEILTVSDMSRMLVRADVDETDVVDVRLGQKAKITVDAMPDTSFTGTVVEIGNTAKRSITSTVEGQTNFEVKVVFDDNVPQVRPGMTADVDVLTATHNGTQGVPIQAVVVRTERELKRAGQKGKMAAKRGKPDGSGAFAMPAEDDTVGRKEKEYTGLFVVKDGMAHFVKVRTGISSETDLEIFGDVKPNDVVVAGPYKALRELKPEGKVKQEQASNKPKK